MHDASDEPVEALHALARSFVDGEDTEALKHPERVSLEAVKAFLVERITALLDRNPTLLMSILYRVDVAEDEVRRAFEEHALSELPPHLADLLIARQLQKLRFRRKYTPEEPPAPSEKKS